MVSQARNSHLFVAICDRQGNQVEDWCECSNPPCHIIVRGRDTVGVEKGGRYYEYVKKGARTWKCRQDAPIPDDWAAKAMTAWYCANCGREIERGKAAVEIRYGRMGACGVKGRDADFYCSDCRKAGNVAIRSVRVHGF